MRNLNRAYRCPVCGDTFSDLHAIARHMALKGDDMHVSWRLGHNLPQKVTIKDREVITLVKQEMFRNISLVTEEKAGEK